MDPIEVRSHVRVAVPHSKCDMCRGAVHVGDVMAVVYSGGTCLGWACMWCEAEWFPAPPCSGSRGSP